MQTLIKTIVIGAILLILVFLSIGIVKIVPKALSSLASATVSIGSIFGGNASSTNVAIVPGTNVNTGSNSNNTTSTSSTGFIVVGSSTSNTTLNGGGAATNTVDTGSASTSILNLIKQKSGASLSNTYVPAPRTKSTVRTNTPSSGISYTTATQLCTTNSQPDLAISVLSRGIISKATGQYVETNNFTTNDTVSIKFKVENRGICSTGSWGFKAEMPSSNTADQIRTLVNVGALPAGTAVTGQVNFDSPRSGTSNVLLSVSDNSGRDADSSNNAVSSPLTVTGTTAGGNGGINTSGDGRADLAVRILQTGILTNNNQFVPTNTFNGNFINGGNFRTADRVAVKFEVLNQGLSATGLWNFKADLNGGYGSNVRTYQNPSYESSISSGGRTVYTIAFDNISLGSNSITIVTDNLNQVNEFNEGNNSATVTFNVGY